MLNVTTKKINLFLQQFRSIVIIHVKHPQEETQTLKLIKEDNNLKEVISCDRSKFIITLKSKNK